MKRVIALVLSLLLVFLSCSGCGRGDDPETDPGASDNVQGAASGDPDVKGGTNDGTGIPDPSSDNAAQGAASALLLGFGDKYVDPALTATGRERYTPVPGPEGTWSIPVPFVNPLGSQALYTGGSTYKAWSFIDIQYVSEFTEFKKRLFGDVWQLRVNKVPGLPVEFLEDYAESLGGTVYASTYADRFIFRVRQPDALWWCDAQETSGGYDLRILKQTLYEPGKTYTVPPALLGNPQGGEIAFVTESTGERFQTVRIGLSSGRVRIFAYADEAYGNSTLVKRLDITLDAKVSKTFLLDNLPQGAGIFDWKFAPDAKNKPGELTFTLEESYPLPEVAYGEDLGALVVKGAPFGSVYVRAQAFVSVDFCEAGQRDIYGKKQDIPGTVTEEGDTLFTLPPGFWTVVNRAPYMNYGSTRTQLVPVSSGEMTVVTLPESLKSANARLNAMSDDADLTGRVDIEAATDKGKTAEIAVSVSDPLERDIEPTLENTTLIEGASPVKVTDIRRVVAPCSIALVIDSSGSMKNDMKGTLAAASAFVSALPAGSFVKVVDFDAKVNVLKGETPAEAAKALAGVTAGGATKLYDATLKGLEVIAGKSRPAVVVFTDGIDSREDKTGNGSVSTREAVTAKIAESAIPVYTIGFGKRLNAEQAAKTTAPVDGVPDIQCLLAFASTSGGQYYPAKDPSALEGVFAAISSKLGNNFLITYERPTEHNLGETPFLSLVVDNSGSMNTDPSQGKDCNYRMEKTIGLFHDFLEKVPDKAMLQFTTFQTPPMSPPLIVQQQITTDNKATLLKTLGEMEAKGGTPVVEALRTAYENILPVPSTRKAIVFLTDGGLDVEKDQQDQFDDLCENIRDKGIHVLFAGMGAHSREELFSGAAKATGGDYVISENPEELLKKLEQLLDTLKEPVPPKTIPLSLSLRWTSPEGEALAYAVASDVPFALPGKAGPALEPDIVKIETGTPWERYDTEVATVVTGSGRIGSENIITSHMPFNKTLSNKAMALAVKQEVTLSRFMGIDGERYGKQFVALEVSLENRTEKDIPYEIPSIFKHFYFCPNGEGLYPASSATWLSEQPLSPHGDPKVVVEPGKTVTGVLVFVVPDRPGFTQQSLHFFDTDYGHIQLALTGKLADKWTAIAALPTVAPAKLSDTFSLVVTGAEVKPSVDVHPAGDRSAFQVVEAQLDSKVQALLQLDPQERIWLKTETESGSLMSRMNDATAALPFGFLAPVMLGPATSNPVRMAFDLPRGLQNTKASLWFDLATGTAEARIREGTPYPAPKAVATVEGPGVRVTVNQLVAQEGNISYTLADGKAWQGFGSHVLLDVTLTDLPGQEGTRIPADFFVLVNKNSTADKAGATAGRSGLSGGGASDASVRTPSGETGQLVFGVNDGFGVFEGQSRRGIVVFQKPKGAPADWTLQSPYVEGLKVPLSAGKFASPELLGYKAETVVDDTFEKLLDDAVQAAVKKFEGMAKDSVRTVMTLQEENARESVPMPPLSTYGLNRFTEIRTEEQVYALLQSLRCLPINREGGYLQSFGYQPEAVISQGWGEIGDMTNLAMRLFAKLGFSPELRPMALTETGHKVLKELTGVDTVRSRTVPVGILYRNGSGERKMLVIPFMMEISGLKGLVYYPSDGLGGYVGEIPQEVELRVSVRYVPGVGNGSAAGTAGDAGSALGGGAGGSSERELVMLEQKMPISVLSTDALDLGFLARQGTGGGLSFTAVLDTPGGTETGGAVLENPAQVLGVRVEIGNISGKNKPLVHYSTLKKGDSLEKFFQTIAINLPDLTEEAAAALDEAVQRTHAAAKNPDPLSIARWYGRSVLYQMIAGQSMYDTQMVTDLGLVLGRVKEPRCMAVTSRLDSAGTMHTTLDLLQPWNEVHAGGKDESFAYSFAAGFYLSSLEAEVLPGENKVGYLELWTDAPEGTIIQAIPTLEKNRDDIWKRMKEEKIYPALLLERVKENEKVLFVPSAPTSFSGQPRWAWMELDPETGRAISVFDTGMQGGMTEFKLSMLPSEDDTVQWLKGIWVGTNVSVWTMCSSTLKYGDNYKAVLIDAKKSAGKAAEAVSQFFDMADSIKNKEFGFELDLGPGHKIEFKIGMSGIKGELKQKLYSLGGGMKLAIDAYFKSIAPPPPKRGKP